MSKTQKNEGKAVNDGTISGEFIKTGHEIKSGTVSAKELSRDHPMPPKPVTVRIEDLKKNLNKVMGESELPPFLAVMVLREMLVAYSSVAETEFIQDSEAWKKACREWEQACEELERARKEGEKDG